MSDVSSDSSLNKLELRISQFLRAGVFFSGSLLLVGWLWMLASHGDLLSHFSEYHPQSLAESLHWAFIVNDYSVLLSFAGLLILVLLPVVRVLMTGVLFVKQKEYRLGLMAFAVFTILVGSFFMGIDL